MGVLWRVLAMRTRVIMITVIWNEIIIDTAGAESVPTIQVALQETAWAIPLKVYCNGKLVNGSEKDFPELEFKWVAIQQETTTPILSSDTLSTEIELNVAVSLPTINWTLIFSVHNRQTETRMIL